MFRSLFLMLTAAAVVMSAPATAASMSKPTCSGNDSVVWVDATGKTFYAAGSPEYGKTAKGKYACASAATAMGAHAAKMSGPTSTTSAPSSGMMPSPGPTGTGPNPPQPRQSGTTSPEP
jgi:hypothetical protein